MNIGFIGLGLIGGSIAKAVRRVHGDYRLIGFDRSVESLTAAMADGTLNQTTDQIDAAFAECDILFLCLPVSQNIACLSALKDLLPASAIITDAGSVKTTIHEAVRDLGMEDRFIGGHPMAGSEKSGYENASDRLLENAYYMLTPAPGISQEKVDLLSGLISDIGALPMITDYLSHDHATAAISHLPHIIAYTLVNFVRTGDNAEGLMRQIAAGGFRDITRIASSSPEMWESISVENKAQLLEAIDRYREDLKTVARAIGSGDTDYLHSFFSEAKDYRDDMPTRDTGSIRPVHEIYLDIIDESGAIAAIAAILAASGISIKNIGIIHNREFQEGVLRIEFYQAAAVDKAAALLSRYNYTIHRRN